MSESKQVYKAIANVMADLSVYGIAKDRKNTGQGYNFRGIDDIYNALSGLLSTHGLVILPRVLSHRLEERETKNGGRMAYSFVDVEFDLVSADDGSCHTARTTGEGMDSADKSTNKAMSAAYKYMAFQVFCIPTEGDNDADGHTHEIKPGARPGAPVTPPIPPNVPRMTIEEANATNYLAKKLKLKSEQFKEFKEKCKEMELSWIMGSIEAESKGCTTFNQLMQFVLEGIAPEPEDHL